MERIDEQSAKEIFKALHKANNRPFYHESLTEIIALTKAVNQSFIATIKKEHFDLLAYLSVLESVQFTKICNADRLQIVIVTALFMDINLQKISGLSPAEITRKINLELVKDKSGLQIAESDEILQIISTIKMLLSIKRAVHLISVYDQTMDVYTYCKKFSVLSVNDLETDLTTLEDTIRDAKVLLLPNEKEAKKIALDYLSAKNYPLIALQDKSVPGLLIILERHYFAAMAVLYIRTVLKKSPPDNQNDLIDHIALFLLDREDLTETD